MTDVPSYVQLQLQAMSDIVADESSTNFRTNNTTSFGINTSTLYFDLYKFEGGKITFANDATFPTVIEAASGANDVVIAAGTLTLSEPISFKAFSLTGTTGDIRKLSLEIGGTRYVAGSTDNGNVRTFEWDEIYVTRTSTVKVIANLETNPSTSISLSPSLISSAIFINGGNYTNTDTNFGANEVAGRIQIAKINVTTPRFALNNNLSTTQNAIVGESASRTIFEGPITSKKNITVDSVTFAIGDIQTGVNFENQNMDLDLYVGNSVIDSKTIKLTPSATVTFNTNIKITETAQTVKIVASLASNGTGRVVATVVANGTDADGNKNSSSPINTVAFRVLPEASVSVTNAGSTSQTVIEGANAQLTEFTASISDGTTNLSKVVISGESLPANTTATLSIGGNTYQSSTATANQIEFSNINASLQEGDYKATITTNVNTDGKLTGTTLKVDQVVLTYTDAASNSKAATGTINATYYFVKAFPVITVASTTTKNQITLKITNGNNSAITISGLHLGGSDATIDGQIISSSHSYTSMVAPVKLDTPRTLAKGESVELVIKASSIETTAKLSAIEYSIVSAGETYNYTLNNTYTNVGKWGEFTVSYSS
ncbi:MAG: hypothetical protein LBG52_08960 [Candidatus Peribacteria bacterium]|jgi:hypothetical protein|nr:hypothetical protein [Candidatus Peribacteria bacterium]